MNRTIEPLRADLRPRRPGFVLTPLIDVIFLLLVFFMLSSQIAPFGLLPVTATGPAESDAARQSTAAADAAPVMLRISRGHISAGGRTITIGELPGAIVKMKEADVSSVVLVTTRSATVQDVVSTLEAFKTAAFERVTLLNRPGAS